MLLVRALHRKLNKSEMETRQLGCHVRLFWVKRRLTNGELSPSSQSSSSYPDGHIDDLGAQVGNLLADVFGTELVCRTVEILRQLHADVVRAWLRAPVA